MHIPEEFKTFVSFFDLDLHDGTPSEQELIAVALKHTPQVHKGVVKAYIEELLNGNLSAKELQGIWFDSGAGVFVPDADEFRRFLNMVRSKLG